MNLDRSTAARAYDVQARLRALVGETVSLTYVKRNKMESASTGEVKRVFGPDGTDKMSVDVLTKDKGMRTINLKGILTINGENV